MWFISTRPALNFNQSVNAFKSVRSYCLSREGANPYMQPGKETDSELSSIRRLILNLSNELPRRSDTCRQIQSNLNLDGLQCWDPPRDHLFMWVDSWGLWDYWSGRHTDRVTMLHWVFEATEACALLWSMCLIWWGCFLSFLDCSNLSTQGYGSFMQGLSLLLLLLVMRCDATPRGNTFSYRCLL